MLRQVVVLVACILAVVTWAGESDSLGTNTPMAQKLALIQKSLASLSSESEQNGANYRLAKLAAIETAARKMWDTSKDSEEAQAALIIGYFLQADLNRPLDASKFDADLKSLQGLGAKWAQSILLLAKMYFMNNMNLGKERTSVEFVNKTRAIIALVQDNLDLMGEADKCPLSVRPIIMDVLRCDTAISSRWLMQLACSYDNLGDGGSARKWFNEVIRRYPDSRSATSAKGILAAKAERGSGAEPQPEPAKSDGPPR